MKKILILITILLLGIHIFPIIGQAKESMGYSVSAIIPDNQIDKTLTYFDLKMEPNQKQEIHLFVSNSSDKEQTIEIIPNNAKTNQNGVIDYSQTNGKLDSSLKIPLTSIISKAQEVTLAPNEKKKITFTLQMPEKSFDGLVLGGFYISKKQNTDKMKETEKDVQIINNYSYVIGIKIRENKNNVKPKIIMNEIKPMLLNYRTAITVNLQNTEATIINGLSVKAKVMKKGGSKKLHEVSKKELSIAPNSNFDFPINWENQILDTGKYTLQLVAKSGEDEWKFEEDFVISSKDSKLLNDGAIELDKQPANWIWIVTTVLFILLVFVILIIYFIYRNKKKKDAEKRAWLARKRRRKKAQENKKRQKNCSK